MARNMVAAAAWAAAAFAAISENDFALEDIITRDVAILGCGASGTYGAFRLREDYNQSIIVIEKASVCGGHTNTYTDPQTGTPVDYGVLSYWDYGPAKTFFSRVGVDITTPASDTSTTVYVDSKTAKNLTDYQVPAFPDIFKSIAVYADQSAKYNDILLPGYWNFPTGDSIPEDLLLPYGKFAEKYGLDNSFPLMQVIAGVGVGGVRDIPTIYVMGFAFGYPAASGLLTTTNGTFVPKSGSNSELYQKVAQKYQSDILLKSTVIDAERSDGNRIRLVVQTPDSPKPKLIIAKHLLVTPAPSISNLKSLALDDQESAVFYSSEPRSLHVCLAQIPSIPRNYTVHFVSDAVVPNHYLDLYAEIQYDLKIAPAGPESLGAFRTLLETSDVPLTEDQAKAYISKQVQGLADAGTLQHGTSGAQVEFLTCNDHSSIKWRLPADEIKAGFIQNLYALQGHRSTWYTGSLWCTDFSSNVWAFTDTVLERMMKT